MVNAERQLVDGAPHHIRKRFSGAKNGRHWRWHYVEHHLAHEASAFLAAPFGESAVMTLDGRGELATTTYGYFGPTRDGLRFTRLGEVRMPHSLGLLYEQVTAYLGFLHSSDEYKVMALASYGDPVFKKEFRDLVRINGDGTYEISEPKLAERFGPARERGAALTKKHFDIARSLQWVLEESAVELSGWLKRNTDSENLCLAGGVALNCVMNARIRDAGLFERVWVQPAAGDAGTALGAALWTDWQARGGERAWHMEHAFFGPSFGDEEIEAFLKRARLRYTKMDDVPAQTAAVLARDAWSSGRAPWAAVRSSPRRSRRTCSSG
jgi:carbamoyltransferase